MHNLADMPAQIKLTQLRGTTLINLAVAALIIAALYVGREIFVPIALAVLLSFVLAPFVITMQAWRIPRTLSVLVVVFILLQRQDLRNRFVRLAGSDDIQRTTAALDEAGERPSRLFLTQIAFNAAYGLAIGIGLELIGVPSAPLWGLIAMILRFVPYVDEAAALVLAQMLRRRGFGAVAEKTDSLSMSRFFSLDLADTFLVCICYVERPSSARIQYAVRRLSKKNAGGSIVLALLETETGTPLASAGPNVAEGPFSVALNVIGEAALTISQVTFDSAHHRGETQIKDVADLSTRHQHAL